MQKKGLVLAGLLCMLVITAMPAYAQQVNVSIGDVALQPQAHATLPIWINNTEQKVSSALINLTYDAEVVEVTAVENSEFDYFLSNTIDGTVSMTGMNWVTSLTTPIKFADVTVRAVGNGGDYTPLNFTKVKLSDEAGAVILSERINGSVLILEEEEVAVAVPAYNIYGISALIGLLAIILGIRIRAKVKRR